MKNIKQKLSIVAFISSILFGIAGFICPPLSIIDSSVLWFIAQLLMFSASLLGINFKSENKN